MAVKGYKSALIDIAMADGSKVPKKVRTWGRMATHKMIDENGDSNPRLTVVTDVLTGQAVFYFRSSDAAGGFASWLNDYLGERQLTSLTEQEKEQVRAVIIQFWQLKEAKE